MLVRGLSLILVLPVISFAFDNGYWDMLLKKHVSKGQINGITLHIVNYSKIKDDPLYRNLLNQIEEFKPSSLEDIKSL